MSMTSQPPAALSTSPSSSSAAARLSPADRARVAVQAGCHADTLRRYERGEALWSTTLGRIERALRNLDCDAIIAARAATIAKRSR